VSPLSPSPHGGPLARFVASCYACRPARRPTLPGASGSFTGFLVRFRPALRASPRLENPFPAVLPLAGAVHAVLGPVARQRAPIPSVSSSLDSHLGHPRTPSPSGLLPRCHRPALCRGAGGSQGQPDTSGLAQAPLARLRPSSALAGLRAGSSPTDAPQGRGSPCSSGVLQGGRSRLSLPASRENPSGKVCPIRPAGDVPTPTLPALPPCQVFIDTSGCLRLFDDPTQSGVSRAPAGTRRPSVQHRLAFDDSPTRRVSRTRRLPPGHSRAPDPAPRSPAYAPRSVRPISIPLDPERRHRRRGDHPATAVRLFRPPLIPP
jgi:hypothetical protein